MSFANAIMTLMQPEVFLAMMVGILGGMIIGILPGLGGTIAAALMMPLTYSLSPTAALVMLTTIYTSAVYGGSFTAILLHTPGTTASADKSAGQRRRERRWLFGAPAQPPFPEGEADCGRFAVR